MDLDVEAATLSLEKLAIQANLSPPPSNSPKMGKGRWGDNLSLAQTAAMGIIQVVNAHMERALRVISVERGFDPRDFGLVSFGGAGGLHACDLARGLGIKQVLIPSGASTLSAFGMLRADVVKDYVQTVMLPGDVSRTELESRLQPLLVQGRHEIISEGIDEKRIVLHAELDIRYLGQSYELTVAFTEDFIEEFHHAHHQAYNYSHPDAAVEIVNLRVRAVGQVPRPELPRSEAGSPSPAEALMGSKQVALENESQGNIASIPFYDGEKLRAGHKIPGPAIVIQKDTTIFLAEKDEALVDSYANLVVDIDG